MNDTIPLLAKNGETRGRDYYPEEEGITSLFCGPQFLYDGEKIQALPYWAGKA
jgi:hypothetical protein